MRARKIDVIDTVSLKQAQAMQKTNPEILQIPIPRAQAITVQPRNDRAPFNDIRVRKAMQMAIDLPTIAKDYYHGLVEPYPSTVTSRRYRKGWGFPYEDWPQDLKDEYAYNPTAARKLLADAGYPNGFKTNVVADIAGDMDLLQIVKTYFADIGIDMEIRPMESTACTAFVESRKYDQLAYRPYGPFGHTYAPSHGHWPISYGTLTSMMVSDPVIDAFYPKAIATTSEDELKQILKDYERARRTAAFRSIPASTDGVLPLSAVA